jgi:hypothetical protein
MTSIAEDELAGWGTQAPMPKRRRLNIDNCRQTKQTPASKQTHRQSCQSPLVSHGRLSGAEGRNASGTRSDPLVIPDVGECCYGMVRGDLSNQNLQVQNG